MFWVKRLKSNENEWLWTLSYGDLVTLILAVFVMIAAMSKLRADEQFDAVSGAVRGAFGFAVTPTVPDVELPKRQTLRERLERAGLLASTTVRLGGAQAAGLGSATPTECQVVVDGERLILRFSGGALFAPSSAALRPGVERVLADVARMLRDGQTQIEVRGCAEDGPLPDGVPFRDAFDLAYARARAAGHVLAQAGVTRDRLRLTASARTVAPGAGELSAGGAELREPMEIVVHAAAANEHGPGIAEED